METFFPNKNICSICNSTRWQGIIDAFSRSNYKLTHANASVLTKFVHSELTDGRRSLFTENWMINAEMNTKFACNFVFFFRYSNWREVKTSYWMNKSLILRPFDVIKRSNRNVNRLFMAFLILLWNSVR